MNKVIITGRLTTKPELRQTSGNIPFTRFTVASQRTFTSSNGEREADFINVVVWRKQAENVCNFLNKGSLVLVEGRLQNNNYTNKEGVMQYTVEVTVDNVEFLETKSQSQNNQNNQNYNRNTSNNNSSNPFAQFEEQPSFASNQVDNDPFADFGNNVTIDDNFLE